MKNYGIIYLVTNKINGKCYIGQTTKTMEGRWKDHIKYVKNGKGFVLHKGIRKYGIENFVVEQIDIANNQNKLNILEEYYIFEYNTIIDNNKGYNLTWGDYHCKYSAASKIKMSKSQIGKKHSEETKQKLREIRSKQTISSESYKKALETRHKNGWYKNQESRNNATKKLVETRRNNGTYVMKQETKNKLRIINTGKKASEETKRKMSISQTGRKMKPESIQKRNDSRRNNNNGKY